MTKTLLPTTQHRATYSHLFKWLHWCKFIQLQKRQRKKALIITSVQWYTTLFKMHVDNNKNHIGPNLNSTWEIVYTATSTNAWLSYFQYRFSYVNEWSRLFFGSHLGLPASYNHPRHIKQNWYGLRKVSKIWLFYGLVSTVPCIALVEWWFRRINYFHTSPGIKILIHHVLIERFLWIRNTIL